MGLVRSAAANRSYSNAVCVEGDGRWIYLAGQLPYDQRGAVVSGTLTEQANACIDRLEELLQIQGADLSDVIIIRTYLTSLEGYAEFDGVRAERFRGAAPASVAVGVATLLGEADIEIEAIAFVSE